MKKIIINTISAKKSSGGAFQISLNFILKSLEDSDVQWYYITSQDLDDVVGDKFTSLKGTKYFTFPTQPDFKGSYFKVQRELSKLENHIKPDVIYSITAPSYFRFKYTEVMRFTNPLVTHPNEYSWSTLPFFEKIKTKLYCLNQIRLMNKANYFITQTETTQQGILHITGLPNSHCKVVNNVLPAAFKNINNTPIPDDKWINIACVGNPVPHKNFDIVPCVIAELYALGIKNIRFHMTIPKNHRMEHHVIKRAEAMGFKENIINHGRVSQEELGEIYRRCQFCFLPTLLEVFSASTVEAMYFNLPIVATDFPFNTEVLADACLYYQPKNPKDAAVNLVKIISDKELQNTLKNKMAQQLSLYGDYEAHFSAIKNYLLSVANKEI